MKKKYLILITIASLAFFACKKEAGEGGNSSIIGNVLTIKTNPFFTDTLAIYAGADEDVYIIYGDDVSYGDRIKSGPDGKFEFKYLRKGNYKIYVYSEDTVPGIDTIPSKFAVMKQVEITEKKQTVDAGTFTIFDIK